MSTTMTKSAAMAREITCFRSDESQHRKLPSGVSLNFEDFKVRIS